MSLMKRLVTMNGVRTFAEVNCKYAARDTDLCGEGIVTDWTKNIAHYF
jgi:hypothetical protein